MQQSGLKVQDKIKTALLHGAYSSGLYRAISRIAGGIGAVLMLHRIVRDKDETPSRYLTVTAGFLEDVILKFKRNGISFVSLDDMLHILRSRRGSSERFVALTFDDGYRDNLTLALPIFRRHRVPFAVYVASGAPDRSMDVWFLRLERILMQFQRLETGGLGNGRSLSLESPAGKAAAYEYCIELARQDLPGLKKWLQEVLPESAVSDKELMNEHFLSWEELRQLAAGPLVTIGGHTISHPMLAKLPEDEAFREITGGVERLSAQIGKAVRHFAYPFGSPFSCGPREFALAERAGFESAVTTRYGNIYRAHRHHLHCLPRMTLGGPAERLSDTLLDVSGVRTVLSKRCFAPVATA